MNSTCENGTKGDPKENDRSPQRALHGTEDRAQAGDVQQLYQEQLPLRKYYEVDAIVDRDCRCLTVVRSKSVVNDFAVSKVSAYNDSKTDNKTYHNNLLKFFKVSINYKNFLNSSLSYYAQLEKAMSILHKVNV